MLPDPDDRRLTWQWPRSIPIDPSTDITGERFEWLEAGVRELKIPAVIIWGREDDVFTTDVMGARWHDIWPHAEGPHLVTGKHFLQEDSGAEIGQLLVEFAARNLPSQQLIFIGRSGRPFPAGVEIAALVRASNRWIRVKPTGTLGQSSNGWLPE